MSMRHEVISAFKKRGMVDPLTAKQYIMINASVNGSNASKLLTCGLVKPIVSKVHHNNICYNKLDLIRFVDIYKSTNNNIKITKLQKQIVKIVESKDSITFEDVIKCINSKNGDKHILNLVKQGVLNIDVDSVDCLNEDLNKLKLELGVNYFNVEK